MQDGGWTGRWRKSGIHSKGRLGFMELGSFGCTRRGRCDHVEMTASRAGVGIKQFWNVIGAAFHYVGKVVLV